MFSNYDYDIIIIGGGISGIFLAYKLLDTNLKVIVLEGNKRVGGRIKTIQKDNTVFEAGAARFHSSHGKLISLVHDLDLEDNIIKLPQGIHHILRNSKENYPYQTKNKESSFHELLIQSVKSMDRFSKGELNEIFRNSISSSNTIVIFHSCRRLQQAWYRHSDDMRSRTRMEC